MEHSPSWEADSRSADQAIRKIPPLDPILSRFNSVDTLTPYFFNIHISIILPSMPKSPK
jgi:hypothetical protein